MKKYWKLSGALALGVALLIMLIVALACSPEEAVPRSYSCNVYTEQGCAKFVAASGGEIEIQSGATLDVQSGATVNVNDLVISDTLNIDDNTSTLTGTQTLAPAASVYLFSPASTLTLTLATGNAVVGDFLWITNITSTANVVIVDTGATAGGGNRTIALNDVIGFIFANAKWLEAFYSDNS